MITSVIVMTRVSERQLNITYLDFFNDQVRPSQVTYDMSNVNEGTPKGIKLDQIPNVGQTDTIINVRK